MSKAVFLDMDSTQKADLNLHKLHDACGHLTVWPMTSPAQRQQHIGDADIVISNKVVLDAPLIQSLQHQVKLICVAATGTNNVDLAAAKACGIPVTNLRDYGTQSVAEHVMAMIMSLKRQLPTFQRALAAGEWQRSPTFCLLDYSISEVAGSTLAIVGYGTLGKAVARLGEALGMHIIIADHPNQPPRKGRVDFDTALQQADIVSLHCPLTAETQNLINAERLSMMKSNAILINTARGGIVDEAALLTALEQGQIAAAGMDVLIQEPPTEGNILLDASLPNLLITPHVAWASQNARQTLIDQLADLITEHHRSGTIKNRVI